MLLLNASSLSFDVQIAGGCGLFFEASVFNALQGVQPLSFQEATQALRKSEERLLLATRIGKVGVWDWDIRENSVYWSDSLYALHGLKKEEFQYSVEGFMALVHPDDRSLVSNSIQKSLEEDAPYEFEFRAIRPDGEIIWLFTSALVLRERRAPIRMLGATVDITSRKKSEEELMEIKEDLSVEVSALNRLYELSLHLAGHIDIKTNLQGILETLVELHGAPYGLLSLCDPTGRYLAQGASFGFDEESLRKLAYVKSSMKGAACEAAFKHRKRVVFMGDGVDHRFECYRDLARDVPIRTVHSTPILNRAGEILGTLTVYLDELRSPTEREKRFADMCASYAADILDAAKAQKDLKESEERFRTMADHAPGMVWMTDAEGSCTYLSRSWYEFTGQDPEKSLGQGWMDVLHPEDLLKVKVVFQEAHMSSPSKREPFQLECRVQDKHGFYHWTINAAAPWIGYDGRFLGYIGSILDITDRKAVEETIRRMNNALEERVRERTIQLENQSNRLRTLADQLVTTEQRERKRIASILHDHLQQILVASQFQLAELARRVSKNQIGHLMECVDKTKDFLLEAIRSARSLSAELRPPVLYEGGLIDALRWLAGKFQKEHGLTVDLDVEEIPHPLTDTLKIMVFESVKEVLFNIVKHAKTKHASFSLQYVGQNLHMIIEDRGVGFDLAKLEQAANQYEGGLGLFSLRERFKLWNGKFYIVSVLGEGTRIEITVPIFPVDPKKVTPGQVSSPSSSVQEGSRGFESNDKSVTILLADDHKIIREGLVNILKERPLFKIVAEAENGLEAFEKASLFKPDVIIMDINMPQLNGIEATRLIKKDFPEVQIIGLSVQDENDVSEAMKKAGAFTLLNKAGDPEELIRTILHCTA